MVMAGTLITSDLFMPSAWTSYTPTWTAATTNPAIGNGSITGQYIQLGPVVWYRGKILMGSTTTYGSGEWRISVPVSADVSITNMAIGPVWLRDSTGPGDYASVAISANTDYLVIRPGAATFGGSNIVDGTHPFGFGSGDWVTWTVFYPEA